MDILSSGGHTTLILSTYHRLRDDIILGKITPGSKLRVEHLKEIYEVGAGTLREAVTLLVADALVVQHGQRGFQVAPISLNDFIDIAGTRVLIECEALRQSIRFGDDVWEGNLASAFHRLTLADEALSSDQPFVFWESRNRAFHEALIAACPSKWLHHFVSVLYRQAERYRHLIVNHPPVPRDVRNEHRKIFDAAIRHNDDLCAQLLTEHILLSIESIRHLPSEFFGISESKTLRSGARVYGNQGVGGIGEEMKHGLTSQGHALNQTSTEGGADDLK